MRVLLSARGGEDLEATVEAEGAGWRVTLRGRTYHVDGTVGESMRVRIDARPVEAWITRKGDTLLVERDSRLYSFRVRDPRAPKLARRRQSEDLTRGELHAPMPGLVVQVLTHEGEEVEAGHPLVVVEAMKMQNALVAPLKGRVRTIPVAAGTAVESGQLLLAITPAEP
jgi:biotin carboxyl carrier protein